MKENKSMLFKIDFKPPLHLGEEKLFFFYFSVSFSFSVFLFFFFKKKPTPSINNTPTLRAACPEHPDLFTSYQSRNQHQSRNPASPLRKNHLSRTRAVRRYALSARNGGANEQNLRASPRGGHRPRISHSSKWKTGVSRRDGGKQRCHIVRLKSFNCKVKVP